MNEEEKKIYMKLYRFNKKEEIKRYNKHYHLVHNNEIKEKARKKYVENKNIVFDHYGNKCWCCGASDPNILNIDHIGGYKEGARSGKDLYKFVIRNGFPEQFRLLCCNCNFAHGHYGYCPHIKTGNTDVVSQSAKSTRKARFDTLDHYSDGLLECKLCKEKHYEFLTIDHLIGNGKKDREKFGRGSHFFRYLRQQKYPLGYQVLCMSCNWQKGENQVV